MGRRTLLPRCPIQKMTPATRRMTPHELQRVTSDFFESGSFRGNRGAPRLIEVMTPQAIRGVQEEMTSDLGVGYGEHRRADAQTSCDSAGSSDPATTEPTPSALPATKPETQPSESPELEPAK